jgi:hypothetical protein
MGIARDPYLALGVLTMAGEAMENDVQTLARKWIMGLSEITCQ